MSENPELQQEQVSSPDITTSFLSSITNKQVNIKLFNDFVYTGVLSSIDGFMNVVLENAEEIVDGESVTKYEEVFIRGNSVLYIGQA